MAILLLQSLAFLAVGPLPLALATRPVVVDGSSSSGSGGACEPTKFPYKTSTYRNLADCRNYTLFDLDAGCMPNWFAAKEVCEKRGMELAPQGDKHSEVAISRLCVDNRFTCWMGGACDPGLCYLMSQDGSTHKQGCYQPVRFVCRDKGRKCDKSSNARSPRRPPTPPRKQPPPTFDKCYENCRKENGWCNPYLPYCSYEGTNRLWFRDFCVASCSRAVKPYACPGRSPPPPPPPPLASRVSDDNSVLYMSDDAGYSYRMYDKDAKQRMPHSGAVKFCSDLGVGWELVPYWDYHGYDAARQLCAQYGFTCWLKRRDTDSLCPLLAADGSLQMQGCEQDVRFVCRKAAS